MGMIINPYRFGVALGPSNIKYGRLYNWYAVNTGKLAPTGWHVPSNDEYETLRLYVASQGWNYDGTTDEGTTTSNKQGKAIASASGWTSSTTTGAVGNTDYPSIRNITGLNILPSGKCSNNIYSDITLNAYLWTSESQIAKRIRNSATYILHVTAFTNNYGLAVRCIRDNSTGWITGQRFQDYDGNIYDTVQIGTQIWMVQSLATTHYNDGNSIPYVPDPIDFNLLSTAAYCYYDNDENNVFI